MKQKAPSQNPPPDHSSQRGAILLPILIGVALFVAVGLFLVYGLPKSNDRDRTIADNTALRESPAMPSGLTAADLTLDPVQEEESVHRHQPSLSAQAVLRQAKLEVNIRLSQSRDWQGLPARLAPLDRRASRVPKDPQARPAPAGASGGSTFVIAPDSKDGGTVGSRRFDNFRIQTLPEDHCVGSV